MKSNKLHSYFSTREVEVINHLLHGKTARETAIQLELSSRTVESYLVNIKKKMLVKSKSQLIEKIIKNFLVFM